VVVSCERSNEPLDSINCREVLTLIHGVSYLVNFFQNVFYTKQE
jgi:hypothetical protein